MQQAELIRLSLSLALVIVLIFVAAWLARRSGLLRSKGQTSMAVLASQSLGGRNSIVVIEVEKQRLVLGVTQHQINLLHTLSEPKQIEKSAFSSSLQQAIHTSTTEPSENHTP